MNITIVLNGKEILKQAKIDNSKQNVIKLREYNDGNYIYTPMIQQEYALADNNQTPQTPTMSNIRVRNSTSTVRSDKTPNDTLEIMIQLQGVYSLNWTEIKTADPNNNYIEIVEDGNEPQIRVFSEFVNTNDPSVLGIKIS